MNHEELNHEQFKEKYLIASMIPCETRMVENFEVYQDDDGIILEINYTDGTCDISGYHGKGTK